MSLILRESLLGVDVMDGERPVALYRVRDEQATWESPKPAFAPVYTPQGRLLTDYRPWDHLWHSGLYFGWVHANESNLWGGAWYMPESGKYERVETHGIQRHDRFTDLSTTAEDGVRIHHELSWLDAEDEIFATEQRYWQIEPISTGYRWHVATRIQPVGGPLTLGATRAAAHYSGLVLRMGPPFANDETPEQEVRARCSEGRTGHDQILGQMARWVACEGAAGGMVAMLDHPGNPRHPTTWFTRGNLLGVAPLATGDLVIPEDDELHLRYGLLTVDDPLDDAAVEAEFDRFAAI
jgi:hypothetical protein